MISFSSVHSTDLGCIPLARMLVDNERRKGYDPDLSREERNQHFETANIWSNKLGVYNVIRAVLRAG